MTETTPQRIDPVSASVACYTEHAEGYASYNAAMVADQVATFVAQVPAGGQVLDAGCGPGRDLARFAEAGLHPVGLDLNPTFVQMASASAPAFVGDLRSMPFPDDAFDGTWACASLVHLPVADAVAALGELARVTRPGGPVYVSVKHAGTTGWADTAHGRRWFQIWDQDAFTDAVTAAGLTVSSAVMNPVFVDVWAHA